MWDVRGACRRDIEGVRDAKRGVYRGEMTGEYGEGDMYDVRGVDKGA